MDFGIEKIGKRQVAQICVIVGAKRGVPKVVLIDGLAVDELEIVRVDFQLEELVSVIVRHRECSGSGVGAVGTLDDEAQRQRASICVDTVGVGVLLVGSLNHAVLSAGVLVLANRGVPKAVGVAVGGVASLVGPPPVASACPLACWPTAMAMGDANTVDFMVAKF